MKVEHDEIVHIYEAEQSKIFGKDDEGRSNEDLVSCLENSNQYGEMMPKASNKAIDPYVLNTGDLCMFVGFDEGQPLKFVTKVNNSEQYLILFQRKNRHHGIMIVI